MNIIFFVSTYEQPIEYHVKHMLAVSQACIAIYILDFIIRVISLVEFSHGVKPPR